MSQPCNFHFDSQSVFTLAQQSLCFPGACPYKFVIAIFQQAKLVEPKLESVFTRAQQSLCFPGYHNDSVFLTTTRVTSRRPSPHRQGGQERLQRRRRGPHLLRGVDSSQQHPPRAVRRLATCRHGSGSSDLACGLLSLAGLVLELLAHQLPFCARAGL